MLHVEVIPILGDNYGYLVVCQQTGQAAVVDPADPEPLLRRAEELGFTVAALWNTHHHFDHTGGNESLLRSRPVPVYGHRGDAERIPGLSRPLEHGDTFALGELEVRALHTPGHTRGAISYLVQDALFSGDTLFGGGCGRLFEGDAPTMYRSLNEVLGALPDETRVYFGHEYTEKNLDFALRVEPDNGRLRKRRAEAARRRGRGEPTSPSTLGEERATNPFLRPDSSAIAETLRRHYPGDEQTPLQVFTRLRQMRNNW